jgi:hypothetical protein
MMKEMKLINSFVLANISDAVVTGVGLHLPGMTERGVRASEMFAQGQISEMLIFKTAITALMIGIYALAASRRVRWAYPIEAALKIGNVLLWVVVAWNELNVGLALNQLLRVN